ncbi:hypothetical protein FQN54_003688 [Arachnomyces sp. PD_36]|nr:hypothetical protein FQN54_003688 [Arachnomyces sp. PD_36]
MSEPLDPKRIEELKVCFILKDEATLHAEYLRFRETNSSTGRMSKEKRELGMAYLYALEAKQEQRRLLELQQQQQQQ